MESDPLTLIKECIEALHGGENYTEPFHTTLRPIHASLTPNPTTTIRLRVTQSICNSLGNFHGGAIATVFDECSTTPIALVRKEGFWLMYGVSRTLNVVYLDAATDGDEVEVVSELVKVGKKLAHIRGTMTRVRDGVLIATCEHGKVSVDPLVQSRTNGAKL